MAAMALGIFAAVVLISSVCCLCYKRPVLGFVSSVVTMILTYLTGCSWRDILIGSGKDASLLGFHRYPAAPVILAILLLTAFVVMIVSILWIVRRNKSKNRK